MNRIIIHLQILRDNLYKLSSIEIAVYVGMLWGSPASIVTLLVYHLSNHTIWAPLLTLGLMIFGLIVFGPTLLVNKHNIEKYLQDQYDGKRLQDPDGNAEFAYFYKSLLIAIGVALCTFMGYILMQDILDRDLQTAAVMICVIVPAFVFYIRQVRYVLK